MNSNDTPARLAAVIRFVQRAEKNRECSGEGVGCEQADCAWRSRCPGHAEAQREVLERLRPPGHLPG